MAFEVRSNKEKSIFTGDELIPSAHDAAFKSGNINLELPFGTIRSTLWLFDGIKVISTESSFHKPIVLDWKGDAEIITMHFNILGRISMRDPALKNAFVLSGNQHNMFYGKDAEGKMESHELKAKTFLIQFAKETFFKIAENGNESIKRFADRVDAGQSTAFSQTNLNIDLRIHNCIDAILNCQFSDPLKRMYFFSKAIELLVLQAESFNRSLQPYPKYLKNDHDKECILFAKDYLIKHIENPPTLRELAKIAGINEFKLKKGFKETFNQTVFEYLSDVRLEKAKHDLLARNKTATQIAYELGYSSPQHFSNAFKKKYNISPTKVSKNK